MEADDPSLNTKGCFNKGYVSSGLINNDNKDLIRETPFMMDNINKNPNSQDRIYDNSYNTFKRNKG